MWDFLINLMQEFWVLLRESAIFILVGFVIAGLLHTLLAAGRWADWLRGLGARSVLLASAVGLPLPLCSCSVLPAALSLRQRGASKGATLSFLISTPETSVQSVLLTYGLLGPIMAIYRPIAACISAVLAGIVENLLERRFPSAAQATGGPDPADCCATAGEAAAPAEASCCHGEPSAAPKARLDWAGGMRHAFVDIYDDVVGWMLLGILVAAVIQVAVPDVVIGAVFGGRWQAMFVMLLIGIPMYVCAEASTPIAAVLISQGVSPGAALVFLLAGPATNIGALGLLTRQLGRRTIGVYLASIAVVSIAMGWSLDAFFDARQVRLADHVMADALVPAWVKAAGAVAFLVMALVSAWRLKAVDRLAAGLDWMLPVRVTRLRLNLAAVLALLVGYASTSLAIVQPGALGMRKVFGKVVAADLAPGMHLCPPYPFGSIELIDAGRVQRLDLSFSQLADDAADADPVERWVLLGDENIASIQCAAHWRMRPGASMAFAYGVADREELVSRAVQVALRTTLSAATIETVFTTAQGDLAVSVQGEAQRVLDACGSGIALVAFQFLDLHAPAEVHEAFRDIASALEDQVTRRNRALRDMARVEPIARGRREQILRAAEGTSFAMVTEAASTASSFLKQAAAHAAFPQINRLRLILEMYDRVLPGKRKCVKPSDGNLYIDLRYGGSAEATEPAF